MLANIFMVSLEESLVPNNQKMPVWLRYVDDTFTLIKRGEVANILNVLNGFHQSIKFTYEKESSNEISFLDVMIKRYDGNPTLQTNIYRKRTDTSIYINWKSFSPNIWKIGTLKGLLRRAYKICSKKEWVDKEVEYLKQVFIDINQYPKNVVDNTARQVKTEWEEAQNQQDETVVVATPTPTRGNATEEVRLCTVLPYQGKTGESIIGDLKKSLKKFLPNEVIPQFAYKGKKLSSVFRVKDKVCRMHQSNLVYYYNSKNNPKCRNEQDYVGETRVRVGQRIYEHFVQDKKSAIRRHCARCRHGGHTKDFKILGAGYQSTVHRKLAEALCIKDLQPTLNSQGTNSNSYKLHLFN